MSDTPSAPPPEAIALQLFFGKMISMAASVVCRLKIPDHLAAGPLSVEELSSQTGSHSASLYRIMRALASVGVFTTTSDGKFELNAVSQLLRTGVKGSMRGIVDYGGANWSWTAWGSLMHSVKTGETAFDHVFGEGCFQHLSKHPHESAVFDEGMTGFSTVTGPAIVQAFDFSNFHTVVDVGGGHGKLLLTILEKYHAVNGIVFDSNHVVEGANVAIAATGMGSRCQAIGGDFFQSVPAGGDAYLMKHIIHDWNDDNCRKILNNCRRVIPATGKLLVVDMVVPEDHGPHPSKLLDLEMMVVASGKERTESEFAELFRSAGFKLTRIIPTQSPVCVIEGVPVA
ncbi:MAG: methyltransferase [Pirellulales bacterium]